MISQWKIAAWLGLLKEIEKSNFHSDKNSEKTFRSRSKNLVSGGGTGNPKKSLAVKVFALTTVATIIYLIFWHGTPTRLDLKCFECDNGNGLKLNPRVGNGVTLPELSNRTHVSSNWIGTNIYEVVVADKNDKKYSFRVKVTDAGTKRVYNFGDKEVCREIGNSTASPKCTCNSGSSDCTCCNGDKSCCESSSSCNNGNGCACCVFMKWVDVALVNLNDPSSIKPSTVFFSTLPTLLYISFALFIARSALKLQGGLHGPGGLFGFGKSIFNMVKTKVTFKDVAGIDEEKFELEEIVDYLKHPSKYDVMGARVPKGVILYGPPGTGKTLLAKAVSGEAGVPFFEASGSSFDDMFVGSGAKRVRELFNKAKKSAPCIVFIDEIDAVASKRGSKMAVGGGGGMADQTINQLLSEMDGFNTMSGIVVMAATNRLDALDEAILRPGRFDRHICIDLPDIKGREAILKIHSKNKNLSSLVDLSDVARKTPGFSGAQLENVLNEATLLAVRANKNVIGRAEVEEAIDRVIGGPAKHTRKLLESERKQIAYHEAGHAIVGLYVPEGESVEKITIIPRGKAAGYMLSAPSKQETFIKRKSELLSTVLTLLAGRASEEIFFGIDKVSSGAANDFYKATNLVRSMITKLGMSEKLGLLQYEPSEGIENPYKSSYSDKTFALIDKEALEIIQHQYEKAKKIIIKNKNEFLLIVECLLLIETIDRKQIEYIHTEHKLPKEALLAKEKLEKSGNFLDISVGL